MVNCLSARNVFCIFLVCLVFCCSARAQTWVETKYFVPTYKATSSLPSPDPAWQVFEKRRIAISPKVESIETLEGADKGAKAWLVGSMVASFAKDGTVSVYPKSEGEALRWEIVTEDTSWTKTMSPVEKIRHDKMEILVYDASGKIKPEQTFVKRVWLDSVSGLPVAQINGRFITIFERETAPPVAEAPPYVLTAIKNAAAEIKKLGNFGRMPPPKPE